MTNGSFSNGLRRGLALAYSCSAPAAPSRSSSPTADFQNTGTGLSFIIPYSAAPLPGAGDGTGGSARSSSFRSRRLGDSGPFPGACAAGRAVAGARRRHVAKLQLSRSDRPLGCPRLAPAGTVSRGMPVSYWRNQLESSDTEDHTQAERALREWEEEKTPKTRVRSEAIDAMAASRPAPDRRSHRSLEE